MASWSGWIAALFILLAAAVPLVRRARDGKRAAVGSPTVRAHVLVGLGTSIATFVHTGLVLPELGSEAAVGAGAWAFAAGALAFLVMIAHAGLGLGLRDPKRKDRARQRRRHATTAAILGVLVAAHVLLLLRARRG